MLSLFPLQHGQDLLITASLAVPSIVASISIVATVSIKERRRNQRIKEVLTGTTPMQRKNIIDALSRYESGAAPRRRNQRTDRDLQ